MREVIITGKEAGQRLDKFLIRYLPGAGKSFLYKMLRKKNIVLNDQKVSGSELLAAGDRVRIYFAEETILKFMEESSAEYKRNFTADRFKTKEIPPVIYEDDHVVFFSKPAGLLSQKADADDLSMNELLKIYLIRHCSYSETDFRLFSPGVVNRLDRNTSGLIMAGKDLAAARELTEFVRSRTVRKFYLTIVSGEITETRRIQGFLKKDNKKNKVKILQEPDPDAAYIETVYMPHFSFFFMDRVYTLLQVELLTGRSHQIRAHLASEGHPVAGDEKYGNPICNRDFKKAFGLKYQLLHSFGLIFPKTEGELKKLSEQKILAPVPELWQKIGRECRIHMPEALLNE